MDVAGWRNCAISERLMLFSTETVSSSGYIHYFWICIFLYFRTVVACLRLYIVLWHEYIIANVFTLMREEVDGNSLKRAMKVIIIPFSIRSRWRSNQTTRCISSRKFMYEPENQNGFTLEPIIEHLLLQLHVCFAGSGNSHDFFSRWTSCHEQNTWYIHTMRKEKNDIQETFEKWIHQHIVLQLLYY